MSGKILKEIYSHRNKKKAELLSGYFKTGRGQYGEGDVFLGIMVPISRRLAIKYKDLPLSQVESLLRNKVHEARLIALLVLVWKYEHGNATDKEKVVQLYLKNTKYINNWDLVDLSAPRILGNYFLAKKDKSVLLKLAKSKNLWEERIAVLSTFSFIKEGDLTWSFRFAKMFLNHEHDLIHKATGWMLREAGKKDEKKLKNFLDTNIKKMPRTMLRYAIERFSKSERLKYLKS